MSESSTVLNTSAASADAARQFLRHTVATLAYRAGKTLRDAPATFADFALGPGTRTPLAILTQHGRPVRLGTDHGTGADRLARGDPAELAG